MPGSAPSRRNGAPVIPRSPESSASRAPEPHPPGKARDSQKPAWRVPASRSPDPPLRPRPSFPSVHSVRCFPRRPRSQRLLGLHESAPRGVAGGTVPRRLPSSPSENLVLVPRSLRSHHHGSPSQPRQHPAQDAARSPRLHGNRLAPPPAAGTLRPGDPRPRRGVEGARGEQTGLTREEGPLQQGAPSPTGPRTTADHRRRQLFGGPTPSAFGGGVSGQGCGRRGRAGGACRTGLLSGRRRWARDGHWSRKRDSSGLSEFKENRQGNRAAPDFEDGLTESKMVS